MYIRNLNEKIKLAEMKVSLFHLISAYGEIIEVNLRQTMRGQVFVTMREQEMADRTLKELRGFVLFGKEMDIQYAR